MHTGQRPTSYNTTLVEHSIKHTLVHQQRFLPRVLLSTPFLSNPNNADRPPHLIHEHAEHPRVALPRHRVRVFQRLWWHLPHRPLLLGGADQMRRLDPISPKKSAYPEIAQKPTTPWSRLGQQSVSAGDVVVQDADIVRVRQPGRERGGGERNGGMSSRKKFLYARSAVECVKRG